MIPCCSFPESQALGISPMGRGRQLRSSSLFPFDKLRVRPSTSSGQTVIPFDKLRASVVRCCNQPNHRMAGIIRYCFLRFAPYARLFFSAGIIRIEILLLWHPKKKDA